MSKAEVCQFLGKSKRTIETYVTSGKLPCQYFEGPNGKTARFLRADVEAVKAQKAEVFTSIAKAAPSTGIALVPAAVTAFTPLADRLMAAYLASQRPLPVYVSLRDACALTGLSGATIKALASEQAGVKTRPFGNGVRYRRADLEAL